MDLALFSETLTPASLFLIFEEIAAASGKSAGRKREILCERILRACTGATEATYVIKIMTGDLRIGLREGLVADAVAAAFACDAHEVRRAVMAAGDIGAVAIAARAGRLSEVRIGYGSPIGFMLATPVMYGSEYKDLRGEQWLVEDKFDGIRAQAHKTGDNVRIFSRTLNDVTQSYPEVADALRATSGDFMLDGEIVAQRGESVLPFRYLQARLQRKIVDPQLLKDVPVKFFVFDILASGEQFLIDEPLIERRARLAETAVGGPHLAVADFAPLPEGVTPEEIHERFEAARARGHEGIMLKRSDAPYHPGRRGKWWLKLKRELSTLDVVVVAVEWGHGKRAKVLSDYTFAVRGHDNELLTIGKAYSGLTDVEIAELTQWFLAHPSIPQGPSIPQDDNRPHDDNDKRFPHAIAVEPKIVLEVAFDIIQPSDLHESGFSLRFPRIVRIRDDKPAEEIDTIERVREIYSDMLAREGLQP
ncbi:MAG TPA: ATP-dependent DNA ligase [Candidatus Rubrimentiphilum sp.]|nr:ATP-dependent DNA ligase [Candidatus Rubrimentiphilum sp.]